MPEVLDWRSAADPRPLVHRAARALAEGDVVAFPTDTVYALAASALIPEAVEKLCRSKKRDDERPMTLAVRGAGEALDWVPEMSALGRRLARRCWPGPVTLVFNGAEPGLASRLSDGVRRRVCPSGSVGLRAPAHRAILSVLQLLPGPLVFSSANPTGAPAATTAPAVVEALGDEVPVVIDDGPTPLGRSSTVIRVNGDSWSVLREGPLSAEDVGRQTACLTVFVCTGNTCRSPLAEVLFKKKLAERLGCPVEELPQRGFLVISAGLAAMMGGAAAEEAVEVAKAYGADLSGHVSRPLTPDLAAQADYLVAMTRGHLFALAGSFPATGAHPRLLSPNGEDVSDPIGGEEAVYRECAEQIWGCLDHLAADILN
jgi:tRNA threonylcarbamoyl adenosine modification protein (Sua5/YciO/YrdC/YwlC family)